MDKTIEADLDAFIGSLDAAEDQAEREGYVPAEELRRRCGEAKAAGRMDRVMLQSSGSPTRPLRREPRR